MFSKDAKFKNNVLDNTQSNSAIVNESILQIGGAPPVPRDPSSFIYKLVPTFVSIGK